MNSKAFLVIVICAAVIGAGVTGVVMSKNKAAAAQAAADEAQAAADEAAANAKAADKELLQACPYGCVQWNEAAGIAQKCNGCAHMLDRGEKQTRCSECCPNQALIFGDLDDPDSEISKFAAAHADELEDFQPAFKAQPSVRYMYLPKPFICGEVTGDGEDIKGAKVTAKSECGCVFEAETDFLGDFEVRGLPSNKEFTVTIEAAGFKTRTLTCRTNAAVNLGEIYLEKI